MEIYALRIGRMTNNMEKGFTSFKLAIAMMEILWRGREVGKASMSGVMEVIIRVTGRMTRWTEKGNTRDQMEE